MAEKSSLLVRTIDDGPWCWQNKQARRRIRDAFDATNNVATALAVYDALCEIASDEQSATFATAHAWVQRMSGVSVSTIKKHLTVLAELGLIAVHTPGLRAKCTYTLLALANDCPTSANHGPTLANATQSGGLATYEESREEFEKKERTTKQAPSAEGALGFIPKALTWCQWLRQYPGLEAAWCVYLGRWSLDEETQRGRAALFASALNQGKILWMFMAALKDETDDPLLIVKECNEFLLGDDDPPPSNAEPNKV